jgi:tellurite resistance protein TerA
MELKQKGDEINISGVKQLMAALQWSTADDFDLAAAYETREGQHGLIYFGEFGNLNTFPFIQLSGDDGGGTEADHQETMRITRLIGMKYIWILCWDYGKIQEGVPFSFKESHVSLTLLDDKNNSHKITLDTSDMGNVALFATIDNSGSAGAKLINSSKSGTLKGLKNIQQLLDVINP